ncbi:MAG: leucyl aminopeptidase [Deltaproteobacteria bacterium]|nr:leucyl aminopeptidase [Deltaproteobacteria bacterium]
MKVTWTNDSLEGSKAALVAIPFRKGGPNPAFERLDRKSRGALKELAREERFKGDQNRIIVWRSGRKGLPKRIAVVGMGKSSGAGVWRRMFGRVVELAARHQLRGAVAIFVDGPDEETRSREITWAVEGLILGSYRFTTHRTDRPSGTPPGNGRVAVFAPKEPVVAAKSVVVKARARAESVVLCRDLVNEPANVLNPAEFAARARALAEDAGLECKVLDRAALAKKGMNLIVAVGQGSSNEPRFVHLIYKPADRSGRRIALVGKGVTFDTGGLCLKPGKPMAEMKTDMAGAAVVLSTMAALSKLGVTAEVHGLIPLAENSVNGQAYRPSDVFKAYSGITVEVVNTDAEGRLLLADALAYATELDPDEIVEHATLTGACVVALGMHRAGLMGTDNLLCESYLTAAQRAGELMWRLPLASELEGDIKSDVADVRNVGGRWGGAITAGLFLKRFVKKTPWIHVDIAGPARAEKGTPLTRRGGTGFGVLSCLSYLESQ